MTLGVRPTRSSDLRNLRNLAQFLHGVCAEDGGENVLRDVARASVCVPLAHALEHSRELVFVQRLDAFPESGVAIFLVTLKKFRQNTKKCTRALESER